MTFVHVSPRVSEKAYGLTAEQNIYVFDVPMTANRQQIKAAIESKYEVTVTGIRTLVQSGKAVRYSRGKNRYPGTTNRKDTKKAYVNLKDGDSIQVFEEPANEETK